MRGSTMPRFVTDETVIAWLLGICLCIILAFGIGALWMENAMLESCKEFSLYVTDRGAMQCAVAIPVEEIVKPGSML